MDVAYIFKEIVLHSTYRRTVGWLKMGLEPCTQTKLTNL